MGQSKPLRRTMALIVEDDEEQRFLSATLFEESEFNVVECASAEAAMAVLHEKHDEVGLIFADVELSGNMDGVELAKIARTELPDVPVIVTSGAGGARVAELPAGADFVPKPWRALDLLIRAEKARRASSRG
jgi:DNA-binding NtrC family response regulator